MNLNLVHVTNEHDADVRKACDQLPQLREALARKHPRNRLELILGLGFSKAREWLARANIPLPKAFKEFQEKRGPTGKSMPYTGNSNRNNIV